MPARSIAALAAAVLFAVAPVRAQEPTVRVRVLSREAPRELTVRSAAPLAVTVDGRPAGTVRSGGAVRVTQRGGEVEARGAGVSARGRSVVLAGAEVAVDAGQTARRYAGAVEVSSEGKRLEVVNAAPLEAYVSSVVAAEYPFAEVEGAKAQAVLARTYALKRAGAQGRYDLDDHTGSQVYRGLDAETATSRRAAAETHGEVLRYGAALAETPYFSSSGGHTADNDAVWAGPPLPYLRGVTDPYDAGSPHTEWETTVSQNRLHRILSDRFGGRVTGFSVARRARSGRVTEVVLSGARRPTVTGSQFRSALNAELGVRAIRSTRFEVARDGGDYVFTGGGFGHGVGMSQYGARGQALAGRSYRDILAYYFAGTSLDGAAGARYVALTPPSALDPMPSAASPRPAAAYPVEASPADASGVVVRRRPMPRREAREATATPRRRKAW